MAYDAKATQQRILGAATDEFARYGVAGARVDRIATAAQANKRAIYDYFGDKDGLFAAVLEQLMADLAEAVPPAPAAGGDAAAAGDGAAAAGGPAADLGAYAERLFDYHRAHPQALRLLMWEALQLGEESVPGEERRTRHYDDKVRAAAAATGRDEEQARTLLFLTMGLVGWSLAMPQVRRMVLGEDASPERLRGAVADAVRRLTGRDG
ncbi:TetR family transcriptional regulator [Kitasatospora sp. NPDC057965]|uniref:TetR family transcriptional regulator n=1 Tax=Kitasatospora sp. NPDC057965 TaxID=3346291 RepID=UPI0036DDFF8E